MKHLSIFTISLLISILLPIISGCALSILTPKPAEFVVYKLDIKPKDAAPFETINVRSVIGNTGGTADNYTAIIMIDGQEVDKPTIYIKPSENKTITFSLIEPTIGQHEVEIGSQRNTFSVYEISNYMLQNDNGICSDSYCTYNPRGQWIKFIPPAIPFQINKIYVQGKRTDFSNPDKNFYTIKIWKNGFEKELFSKDYPYSNFTTNFTTVEHEINPPLIVADNFTVDFISHSEDPGVNQKPDVAIYTCVDFTVESSQYNGTSRIGTIDLTTKETAISNDPRWEHASWIIQAGGAGNKAAITPQAGTGKQYRVYFDRSGDLQSVNLDGTEYTDNSYKSDRSPDGKTRVFSGETAFNFSALYLANADLTNQRPIIPIGGGLSHHVWPAWSPDGNKIAFSKAKTYFGTSGRLFFDIWMMNPDGTDIKKISDTTPFSNPRTHSGPQWFPDSKKIVYASNESGSWEIYMTPIDKYEPELIVKLQQTIKSGWVPWDYKISPDGKRMVYRDGTGTDLKTLVIDISSKKIMEWPNIDTSEISPVLSQDGIVAIITKQDGLYYIDSSHDELLKIPNTHAGDIAIRIDTM